MELTLGFSSCPNDTFMFDALVNKRIDTMGLGFHLVMEDIEHLNQRSMRRDLDITKVSYHAWLKTMQDYRLLQSGSALGYKCGPLLIARRPLTGEEILEGPVAIPGELTTANMLFQFRYPGCRHIKPMLFSEIETAVQSGAVSAGVIIHENRFTYADKGLVKILDLGEYWEKKTKRAIPLGGIVMKRLHPETLIRQVETLIARSVEYAFQNPTASDDFVRAHAQEMDADVLRSHINLYVNQFSVDLGKSGRESILELITSARASGLIPLKSSFSPPELHPTTN